MGQFGDDLVAQLLELRDKLKPTTPPLLAIAGGMGAIERLRPLLGEVTAPLLVLKHPERFFLPPGEVIPVESKGQMMALKAIDGAEGGAADSLSRKDVDILFAAYEGMTSSKSMPVMPLVPEELPRRYSFL
jgi:hypothetical protein